MENKIIMHADYRIHFKDKKDIAPLYDEGRMAFLSTGGFGFTVNDKYVYFDFKVSSTQIVEDCLRYKSEKGAPFHEFIMVEEPAEWKEVANDFLSSVVAEYLSKVIAIDKFIVGFELDKAKLQENNNLAPVADFRIEILNISFFDKNNNEYKVADEVIQNFNKGIA